MSNSNDSRIDHDDNDNNEARKLLKITNELVNAQQMILEVINE
ncbi:MAG: hypothetical protein QM652_08835 [Legionella sp.]